MGNLNANNFNANNFNAAQQLANQANTNNANASGTNAAPAFQLSGLSSVNLLQNLPDILNNLSQIAAGNNNNAAPAPALNLNLNNHDNCNNNNVVNPFEPNHFTTTTTTSTDGTSGLPHLLGNLEQQMAAAASMPPPLSGGGGVGGLGDATTGVAGTTNNFFEPRPIIEKRHSLALGLGDIDWLKNVSANANANAAGASSEDQTSNAFNQNISAAFAA